MLFFTQKSTFYFKIFYAYAGPIFKSIYLSHFTYEYRKFYLPVLIFIFKSYKTHNTHKTPKALKHYNSITANRKLLRQSFSLQNSGKGNATESQIS